MEPVQVSNDWCDQDQISHPAVKLNRTLNLTEKPSLVWMRQHLDFVVGHHQWRHAETIPPGLSKFQPTLVHKTQEIVLQMPTACETITPNWAFSPATLPSSNVALYSSPLGIQSTTTPGIRTSSPPSEPSTRETVCVWQLINSRRNMVTGMLAEILGAAMDLMLQYTLYVNPFPNPVALTFEVPSV